MDAAELDQLAASAPGPFVERYRVTAIGTIEVGSSLALWDGMDVGEADRTTQSRATIKARCRPGRHDVLAVEAGGNSLLAVMVRRPDARVASWRRLRVRFDYDGFAVVGPDPLPVLQALLTPPDVVDAFQWVLLGALPDGLGFVWINDPSGSGQIGGHVGLDTDGTICALVVELYG